MVAALIALGRADTFVTSTLGLPFHALAFAAPPSVTN